MYQRFAQKSLRSATPWFVFGLLLLSVGCSTDSPTSPTYLPEPIPAAVEAKQPKTVWESWPKTQWVAPTPTPGARSSW
jgi:hypothetical protein